VDVIDLFIRLLPAGCQYNATQGAGLNDGFISSSHSQPKDGQVTLEKEPTINSASGFSWLNTFKSFFLLITLFFGTVVHIYSPSNISLFKEIFYRFFSIAVQQCCC